MKKLLKFSTLALVMLSLFAVSCEKEKPEPAPAGEVKVTWTPEHHTAPITTTGDIKDGEAGKSYVLVPTLAAPPCANGTWSLKVEPPEGAQLAVGGTNPKTGLTNFKPISRGTYKFIFTYKCPDGTSVSISISITVK